jgi:hypothetical protein
LQRAGRYCRAHGKRVGLQRNERHGLRWLEDEEEDGFLTHQIPSLVVLVVPLEETVQVIVKKGAVSEEDVLQAGALHYWCIGVAAEWRACLQPARVEVDHDGADDVFVGENGRDKGVGALQPQSRVF